MQNLIAQFRHTLNSVFWKGTSIVVLVAIAIFLLAMIVLTSIIKSLLQIGITLTDLVTAIEKVISDPWDTSAVTETKPKQTFGKPGRFSGGDRNISD